MDDHFDEGEAHFYAAAQIYKGDLNQATVANNHADLLAKKGKLILEEAEDLVEDFDELKQAPPPASATQTGLCREHQGNTAAPAKRVRDQKLRTLKSLAQVREEAADAFMKADELRKKAYALTNKLAQASEKEEAKVKAKKAKINAAPIVYKSPAEIFTILEQVAIGQRAAKRGLANAASQHIRRMQLSAEVRANTDKSNVMLLGPTGCGKTLLARGLAGAINVPFYGTEATKLTAAGYVGEDVQSILVGLLRACDFDVERAQNGIIYLDEIDKIAAQGDGNLDVGGESVQEELLTILEGTVISVPKDGNKRSTGEHIDIDTTNILFILGGAFVGLDEIVSKRIASDGPTIGFGADVRPKGEDKSGCLKQATAADFIKYGMLPEFIGRVPKRLVIEALSVDQLERILIEPEKALVVQKRLLLLSTTDLRFTKGALRAIAEEAHKTGTHGRALREIVEQVLEPIVYNEPAVAIITAEMVANRNAEIEAINREDDGVTATAKHDFIVEDDAVEETLATAQAEAQERRAHPSTPPRTGRELMVIG